jgi:hypothetical protein
MNSLNSANKKLITEIPNHLMIQLNALTYLIHTNKNYL